MRFLYALTFLTILPSRRSSQKFTEADFARSSAYYPLIGLIIGALLSLIYILMEPHWTQMTVHVSLVLSWVVLTGGLHLDGLADTIDGLLGGTTIEKRLAIMKDSRLGPFGGIGLFFALALKTALLGELDPVQMAASLLLAPTLGRWAMVLSIQVLPVARPDGLGYIVKKYSGWREFLLATLTTAIPALLLLGFNGVVVWALLALALAIIGWLFTRSLGGMTGDTYGATCELSEILVIFLLGINPLLELL